MALAGKEEIAIPQYGSTAEAAEAHPLADVFINFSSFRSAYESSMEALALGTIRVVAVIAEGIPERDTKVGRVVCRGVVCRGVAGGCRGVPLCACLGGRGAALPARHLQRVEQV